MTVDTDCCFFPAINMNKNSASTIRDTNRDCPYGNLQDWKAQNLLIKGHLTAVQTKASKPTSIFKVSVMKKFLILSNRRSAILFNETNADLDKIIHLGP